MRYIVVQNVKALAHDYSGGKRVGLDFLEQLDKLVEQCVMKQVRSQGDALRKTMTTTEWCARQIRKGKESSGNWEVGNE